MAGLEYIRYKTQVGLGHPRMLFSATPYEGGAAQNNQIYTYDGNGRRDAVWLGSQTTGNGWQHNVNIVGNKKRRDTVWGGRAMGIKFTQYANTNINPLDGGFLPLGTSTDTVSCYGIIKDDGGVSVDFPAPMVQSTGIVGVTPEHFLAKQRTPRLPYLLASVAAKERAKYATLKHTVADLGFTPTVIDPLLGFDKDPFANFGRFVDVATLSWDGSLSSAPANEAHFLASCSVAYALQEYYGGHVRVNGSPIGQIFGIEIQPDFENAIISIDISDGSPHSIALSAQREGNYRCWWDYKCGLHFVPDYCNPFYGGGVSAGSLNLAMIAGLRVVVYRPAPLGYPRVNRVYAEGQWSSAIESGDDLAQTGALQSWKAAPNKAVYPPGQGIGLGGQDVSIQGAHLTDMARFTRSEYNRLSQTARVTIENFPYVVWAIKSYNRIVKLSFPADPLGNFPEVVDGYYSLESVTVTPQNPDEPGGGFPNCTLEFQEIISNT